MASKRVKGKKMRDYQGNLKLKKYNKNIIIIKVCNL